MSNPENKENKQPESTNKNQNNVSEFNPQSSKVDTSSFGSGGNLSEAGTTPQGGLSGSSQGNATGKSGMSSPGGKVQGVTGSGAGTGAATATARSFIDQAKETAGQAYEAVTEKATTTLDQQKTSLTGGLTTVADSIRQVGQNLESSRTDSGLAEAAAKYTNTAAQKIQDAAGYFDSRSVRDMARDLEGYARRNPAVFFGAAFGLGILAARFLKSTPTRHNQVGAGSEFARSSGSVDRQLNTGSSPSGTPDLSSNRI